MVSKVKPNWGKKLDNIGMWLPDLSDEFKQKALNIFDLKEAESQRFLDGVESIIHIHLALVEESKEPKDTKKKTQQAAINIKLQAEKLSQILQGNAGGMKQYLDYPISIPLRGNGNTVLLEEFNQLLGGIKNGCDHYLDDIYPNHINSASPKEIFAKEIMTFYREFFNEEPKTYLSEDGNEPSKYAQLLRIMFIEARENPKDGTLRKLMSWAKNN